MDDTYLPHSPDRPAASVRTPLARLSCPVCGIPLTGKQSVCSPKCRAARSRERRAADGRERDALIRIKLGEILELLEENPSA